MTADPLRLTPSGVIQSPFYRKRPPIERLVHRDIDPATFTPLSLLDVDDDPTAADSPKLHRRNPALSSTIQNRLSLIRLHRKNYPRLAFTEQERIATQRIEW